MKLPGRESIAARMTAVLLLSSGLALIVLTLALVVVDHRNARQALSENLATLAEVEGQNSAAALRFDDAAAGAQVLSALRADSPVVMACLYRVSGALFAEYVRDDEPERCPRDVRLDFAARINEVSVVRDVVQDHEVVGLLRMSSDLRDVQRRMVRFLWLSAILLMITLGIGGFSGAFLQGRILHPIEALAGAMQEVRTQRDFSVRVDVPGSCEVGQLALSFNDMLGELQRHEREAQAARTRLQYQALNDELTDLPNRRLMQDRLGQALAVAERNHTELAVLFLDLDGFKLVNDSLGHTTGDKLLREAASRLRSRVRASDTLARMGGDEFTVVLSPVRSPDDAATVARELLTLLATPFVIDGQKLTISASIGISLFPQNAREAVELMQQADCAMYAAKRGGKNRFEYYHDELGNSMRERTNLEAQLRAALDHGDIQLHYQPEFDAKTKQLIRFEALARWTHPTLGVISPAKFIPVAEESGLIVPLGNHVLETACRAAKEWQSQSGVQVGVAVNVSSVQFERSNIVEIVRTTLERTQLPPSSLQIELTESVMLSGAESARRIMDQLHGLGIGLAIDDFGTGYSSLSYLPALPFDALKIDRSFVREVASRPQTRAMIHTLVALAREIGIRVIVEGVETPQQYRMLQELGAEEVQGFLLGKPTPDPMDCIRASVQLAGETNSGSTELVAGAPDVTQPASEWAN